MSYAIQPLTELIWAVGFYTYNAPLRTKSHSNFLDYNIQVDWDYNEEDVIGRRVKVLEHKSR